MFSCKSMEVVCINKFALSVFFCVSQSPPSSNYCYIRHKTAPSQQGVESTMGLTSSARTILPGWSFRCDQLNQHTEECQWFSQFPKLLHVYIHIYIYVYMYILWMRIINKYQTYEKTKYCYWSISIFLNFGYIYIVLKFNHHVSQLPHKMVVKSELASRFGLPTFTSAY